MFAKSVTLSYNCRQECAMHIQIGDMLAANLGTTKSFRVADERPNLEDVVLVQPLDGRIQFVRAEETIEVRGEITTATTLDCHRCLRTFTHPVTISLNGEFSRQPTPEQWPIKADGMADVAELIRSEIIASLPMKQLCENDCPGLCQDCG
jgi:uncharacterized protein